MSLETRDPRLFFSRCTNPTTDRTIPDNRLSVQHSVEADDVPGLARSLLLGWMKNSEASVTTLSDRVESVQGMANDVTAWHCGGGNQHSTGDEIVGRASWSVDQWNTPTMDLAVRNVARTKARRWAFYTMPKFGISYYPEWLSLAQIGDGVTCGLCTHNDMRLVYGGTTHTDPGPNFPYQKLRNYIHAELNALLGKSPAPITTPGSFTPLPNDPSVPVFVVPPTDWFDSMSQAEKDAFKQEVIDAAFAAVYGINKQFIHSPDKPAGDMQHAFNVAANAAGHGQHVTGDSR